jgi:cytochrome c-type biogenesis protein CcmH
MAHTSRLRAVCAGVAAGSLALLVAVLVPPALAASSPALDEQVRAVAARLRCPVCQNESVADSPSELSGQMREDIRRRLQQGESPDAIVAYFVSRYGQWILLDPPRRGLGWILWLAPAAVLAAGLVIAIRFVRRTAQG